MNNQVSSQLASFFLTLAAILTATTIAARSEMSTAVREASQSVAGLEKPAEIILDQWGIAHVYAGSKHDMYLLQGHNAARDRLWQIDLWRKRGLGLLAKDFGPNYVAQDRAARLFLYRGDINQEWAAYGPEAKASTEAFVAGLPAGRAEVPPH